MATFIIPNKGHTLGNIIRYELLKNDNVILAAYKVTHPLKEELQLYVKIDPESNKTEKQIINETIDNLINKIKILEKLIE
jgi:DNA-directed RNA polymerase subunit L